MVYGNTGNVDAPAQLLTVRSPEGAQLGFGNLPRVSGVPLRIFAAGSAGGSGRLAPGSTNSAALQFQAQSTSPLTLQIGIVDTVRLAFDWERLARSGKPVGLNQENWAALVQSARAQIGDSWDNVMAAVRNVADSSGQDPQTLANFDRLLRYTLFVYAARTEAGAAKAQSLSGRTSGATWPEQIAAFDASKVKVYAQGPVVSNPERSFVLTHGWKGTTDGDRFHQAATALKAKYPNANVFIVDGPPLAQGWLPGPVANNIDPTGDAAARTFKAFASAGTFDPMKATFIGESYGNYVNYRIAENMGGAYQAVVGNPASELGGKVPPDFQKYFARSVSLETYSIADTNREVAQYNLFQETPEGLDAIAQHTYVVGVSFWAGSPRATSRG